MEIAYHIVGADVGFLERIVTNPYEDLSKLASAVKQDTPEVTKESLSDFFLHHGVIAVAVYGDNIVGAACLVRVYKYNGFTYRIEHVSVLPEFQGRRIARYLVDGLHRTGVNRDGRYVDLTCEPFRERARKLYQSLGYVKRETDVFRLKL